MAAIHRPHRTRDPTTHEGVRRAQKGPGRDRHVKGLGPETDIAPDRRGSGRGESHNRRPLGVTRKRQETQSRVCDTGAYGPWSSCHCCVTAFCASPQAVGLRWRDVEFREDGAVLQSDVDTIWLPYRLQAIMPLPTFD